MQNDRELDRMIDAALPGYSSAEPRPGLEDRVIARALVEKPRFFRIAWQWSLALPAFAALLVLLFLPRTRHQPLEPIQRVPRSSPTVALSAPETTPAPHAVSKAKKTHPSLPVTTLAADQQPLPKQQVFPTPSPLTAEERTLVAYSRVQFRELPTKPTTNVEIDPIRVAELQIKPLTIPALNTPASSPSDSGWNDQKP
jgi:hypothetical protein